MKTITLNVDTGKITKDNTATTCSFVGQAAKTHNKDFTITANVGEIIIWEGVSSTSPENDTVHIRRIKYEDGTKIFKSDKFKGVRKVSGEVIFNTKDKPDYKYKISFTVFNDGVKRNGLFKIDPKIQVPQ